MKRKNELVPGRAELERQIRAEIEREAAQVAKPIFGGIVRWIQTTAWWKLVLAYILTWPLGIAEVLVIELLGFIPGMSLIIDGFVLHAMNEFIFLTLPILLLIELSRRTYWQMRRMLRIPERRTSDDGVTHDVIDAEEDD